MKDAGRTVDSGGAGGRLFVWIQYLLPQHALSRLVLAATRVRTRWFKNWTIRGFLKLYRVDMSEAAETDPYRYGSFNEFFTRALKAGARPIAGGDDAIACPVDGCISEAGGIDRGSVAAGQGPLLPARGTARRAALGEPIRGRILRHDLSRTIQLSPRAHAAARRTEGYRVRTGPPVQRQCRDGAACTADCSRATSAS